MKVGFIGDVHGDLRALQWALEALADVDRRVCLGDVVDGARDRECIELLQARDVLVLQGNHDLYADFSDVGSPHAEWLRTLPLQHVEGDWHAWHSLLYADDGYVSWDYVYYDRDVRRMLRQTERTIVLAGHTHVPAVHIAQGERLLRLSKEELMVGPQIRVEKACRYAVNVGRPTQCVVVCDDDTIEFRFQPLPLFERRFGETFTPRTPQ